MADRPSKKERRDLAKLARIEAEKRARRAAARRRLVTTLVVLGIIAGIVGLFVFQSQRNAERAQRLESLASELGCDGPTTFDYVGGGEGGSAQHIPDGEVTYERMPPEAGDHRPSWAKTGVHEQPIETELSTHNLEHGAVLIQYAATVRPEVVTALNNVAFGDPQWAIAAPYEEFNQEQVLSLTSWEVRIDCPKTTVDQAAQFGELARLFLAAHKDSAPESVPGEPISADEQDGEDETTPTPTETMAEGTGSETGSPSPEATES